jgi:hypothetical protein
MSDEFVLVRHRVTGSTWNCPAAAAREWAAQGWEPVPDGDEPPAAEAAAPAAPASKSRTAAASTTTERSEQ